MREFVVTFLAPVEAEERVPWHWFPLLWFQSPWESPWRPTENSWFSSFSWPISPPPSMEEKYLLYYLHSTTHTQLILHNDFKYLISTRLDLLFKVPDFFQQCRPKDLNGVSCNRPIIIYRSNKTNIWSTLAAAAAFSFYFSAFGFILTPFRKKNCALIDTSC